jgi:hypothetical protein
MAIGNRRVSLVSKCCANQVEEFFSRDPVGPILPQLHEAFFQDNCSSLAARQGRRILSFLKKSYLIG